MKKLYIVRSGPLHTNWEYEPRVFPTKKLCHEYMKTIYGFGCYRSRKSCYGQNEEIYENITQEFGYEILEVEVITEDFSELFKKKLPRKIQQKVGRQMMQLGEKLYTIKQVGSPSCFEVEEHVLTGLVRKTNKPFLGDAFEYHLDGAAHWHLTTKKITVTERSYNLRLFRSKKKAENVVRSLNEQRKAFRERLKKEREREKEIKAYNKEWIIKTLDVVGKQVMVKVGWQHQRWAKATIRTVYPSDKEKNVYMFRACGNWYISSRAGKNWYFWSELDELKKQREEIDKKIAEKEKESERK